MEVIRARGLVGKPGSKSLPGNLSRPAVSESRGPCRHLNVRLLLSAPYVKVYLLENGVCIAKKKTKVARKTLDPLYQQLLPFEESPGGKVLQVREHRNRLNCSQIGLILTATRLFCPGASLRRSSCGATMDVWTTNHSWEQFRYC